MNEQSKRRRIVLAGANDGMLHAFDGGFWDRDRAGTTEDYHEIHDLGTGTELFAWVPQAVMNNLFNITAGGSLIHTTGLDMVDGPIVKGDAFIDFDGDSNREWRTVALTSMRRGGRGILALDITQPDPIGADPDYVPAVSVFPGCADGTDPNCSGEYPRVMWEFSDTADADANGIEDLGWTWSKPAIARIAVYNSSTPGLPDDVFVAFFGGGWDKNEADSTGQFFYAVDLETGAQIFKTNMSVDLPGGITALDSDVDGFHDRIYFADSNGGVWRLQYPSPTERQRDRRHRRHPDPDLRFQFRFPGSPGVLHPADPGADPVRRVQLRLGSGPGQRRPRQPRSRRLRYRPLLLPARRRRHATTRGVVRPCGGALHRARWQLRLRQLPPSILRIANTGGI